MNANRERLVVRAPNHLGDLVMSLPALSVSGAAAVVVRRGLAPLLRMAIPDVDIVGLDRGLRPLIPASRALRRGRFTSGVLLTPSFSSALLFRLGGVSRIRGSGTDRRASLLDDVVPRSAIDAIHRTVAYWMLVTGALPATRPVPVLDVPRALHDEWRARLTGRGARVVGIFPGSNASSRRWPAERFAELTRRLAGDGFGVVVFGGTRESGLTQAVAGDSALDLGGRTDLQALAAALGSCDILVSNDSGPLHLAAAVGTPTVSLWGAGNPGVTGLAGSQHVMIRRSDLACVPCVKNTCPRHGAGFTLPDAVNECLNLIEAAEVIEAVHRVLEP